MVAFNKFNTFVADVATKVHNLASDTLMVMLTNAAPLATNTVKANITEIAAGNGYVAGGMAATQVSSGQSGGVYTLVLSAAQLVASGNVGPFRYAVLYNQSSPSGSLIAWFDNGSPITLASGQTFVVGFDQSSGLLTLT